MVAASPIASGSALAAPERILGAEDARAYRRYLEWSVGHGFKLAIIEVTMPRRRDQLIAWTREAFPAVCVVDIDQAERRPLMAFLEEACPSPKDTSLLVLTRLDDAEDRIKLCARLNIQRDELARAFPLPWVLIVHPATRLELEMHAPDFIDFAAVWLREESALADDAMALAGRSFEPLGREVTSLVASEGVAGKDLLRRALAAIELSRYDEALDLLARYDIHHPEARAHSATRMRLDGLLLWLRGHPVEALLRLEDALLRCDRESDQYLRAALFYDISRIRETLGEVDEALKLRHEALRIFEELGANRARAMVMGDLARLHVGNGELDQALRLYEETLRMFEEVGDLRLRAATLVDIASLRSGKGESQEALRLHEEALRVFDAVGDRHSRAVALGHIARIRAITGEADEALRLHAGALRVFDELGDLRSRALTLGSIAYIHASRGQMDDALALLRETLRIVEGLGDLRQIAEACWSLGQVEARLGHFHDALTYAERAYALVAKSGRLDMISSAGALLGALSVNVGNMAEGIAVLESSRDGFEQLGRYQDAQIVQQILNTAKQDQVLR